MTRRAAFAARCSRSVLCQRSQYEKDKQEGRTKSEETSRLKAKHALDKYIHYFDRYINHDRARKIALRSLDDIEAATAQLQTACGYKLSDVTFIRGMPTIRCPAHLARARS